MSDSQDPLAALLLAWRRDIDSEPFRHAVTLHDTAQRWAAHQAQLAGSGHDTRRRGASHTQTFARTQSRPGTVDGSAGCVQW